MGENMAEDNMVLQTYREKSIGIGRRCQKQDFVFGKGIKMPTPLHQGEEKVLIPSYFVMYVTN
jgi:hypothetical protein